MNDKIPSSSIAQSCLQKLGCSVNNPTVVLPNMSSSEINERLVPALRCRTV